MVISAYSPLQLLPYHFKACHPDLSFFITHSVQLVLPICARVCCHFLEYDKPTSVYIFSK